MDIEQLKAENAQLKAANQELQNQLDLMKTIYDSLSEGVVASSTDGEFLLANPTAVNIAGMDTTDKPPEEWSETYGTFYPDTITPVPSSELPLVKAMQGMITDDVELFLRNQNRPEGVFISVSGRPLHDQSGKLIGGVILMRDITPLKNIQTQLDATTADLENQAQLLDTVFNNISDGIVVADQNGKYVLFNAKAEEMGAAKARSKHIARAPQEIGLFRPDDESYYPVNELPLTLALLGENTDNVEMLIRNDLLPDGLHVSINGRPIFDEKGFPVGAVAVIRDITLLKNAESRLKESITRLEHQTQLMESTFNSISDGIVVADKDGNFTMFNPSARRYVGVRAVEVPMEEWSSEYGLFYTDKTTRFPMDEVPLVRALRGESTDNIEMYVNNSYLPEGAYVNVSGRPLRDRNGVRLGGVVVFHDITHRIRTADALAQAFAQGRLEIVETILHNIGNAINSVAVGVDTVHEHLANDDLPQRLTTLAAALAEHQDHLGDYIENHPQGQQVLPFITALATDLTDAGIEFKQTIERIRDKTAHIVDIVRTQKSYGNTSDTRKDLNLTDALSAAIRILHDSIEERNIQMTIDCDDAPPEIRIQESQFHQMIVNIVKNSIDAIDELTNADAPTEAPRIQIRAYADSEFLRIDVTDSGIGFVTNQPQTLFSAGYTTKRHGSGLGLHSSANFVMAAGGQISASSDGYGKGAAIHIVLPCSRVLPPPRDRSVE